MGNNKLIDFNQVVENRVYKIKQTLIKKGREYSSEGNRFHNFDIAARMKGSTPEKALDGMLLKHIVSVDDMINNPHNVTVEMIDEKIGDVINYMILLEGLLLRRLNHNTLTNKDLRGIKCLFHSIGIRIIQLTGFKK